MKVIGVAGFARCGKDTFVKIAIDILKKNGYVPIRFAFADMLKDEVECMLTQNEFKATVRTEDSDAKTLIRPLLVWWGCQRRYESDGGLYWVDAVSEQIKELTAEPTADRIVALISDVRFPNEAKWVHETWGGSVIHLKKWQREWRKCGQDGSDEVMVKVYDSAPNEEEAKQDPLVEAMADVKTEWEGKGHKSAASASGENDLQKVVFDALNKTKYFKHPEPVIGTLSL